MHACKQATNQCVTGLNTEETSGSESVCNTRQRREINDSPQIWYNLLKGLFSYIPLHLASLLVDAQTPPGAHSLTSQSGAPNQIGITHSFSWNVSSVSIDFSSSQSLISFLSDLLFVSFQSAAEWNYRSDMYMFEIFFFEVWALIIRSCREYSWAKNRL